MKLICAVAIVFVVAGVAWSAGAQPLGSIAGTVENRTGGLRPVAGQQVTLTAYVNNAEADWQTTTTDGQGRFAFSVPATADRIYVVTIAYKGADYASAPITFRAGERRKGVLIRVFEPTTDAARIRVNVHHVIVDVGEGVMQIAELLVFVNAGDRTYVGAVVRADGKRETLRFTLPSGAANLEYLEGLTPDRVFAGANGMVDTAAVPPGMRQVAFSYNLPLASANLRIVRTLDYPTDRVELFSKAGVRLEVPPLTGQPPVTTAQGSYTRFSGGPLGARETLTLQFTGLPAGRPVGRWLIIAIVGGLAAAGVAYPLLRRGRRVEPTARREQLVAAIARLDDEFEAGTVSRQRYEAARARYKSMLQELWQATGTE